MVLTIHPSLAPRSSMGTAIPPLPLSACLAWHETAFTILFWVIPQFSYFSSYSNAKLWQGSKLKHDDTNGTEFNPSSHKNLVSEYGWRQNLHIPHGQYDRTMLKNTALKRNESLLRYFLLTLMTYKSLKHIGIQNSPAICKNNISISYLPLYHDADCLCSYFNLFSNIRVNGFHKFLLCLLEKRIQTYHIQYTYKMSAQ